MRLRSTLAAASSLALVVACGDRGSESASQDQGDTAGQPTGDTWGPLVELKDDSNVWPSGKPAGGWWVTPIHASLLPTGKVLVTGWGRRDHDSCAAGGTRKNGTSFVLDPSSLANAGATLGVAPIDENARDKGDVLYCSGHVPLKDGRILFTGGARYNDLGGPAQEEFGLDYARLYDPASATFQRIAAPLGGAPAGQASTQWYPTTARLPDGRVLVTGGFFKCCDGSFSNLSVQTFDADALGRGDSPWTTLLSHVEGHAEMAAGLRDFTHVWVLPTPIAPEAGGGVARQVAMMGWQGRLMLLNTSEGVDATRRVATPTTRPGSAPAWDSTAALTSTGELLTVGGTNDPNVAQRADLYDPRTGSWRSLDTQIGRRNASSVLLPDGNVLVMSGDDDDRVLSGDRKRPQSIDPRAGRVTTFQPWPNDANERGYHNMALLLKDGRVLVGGGTYGAGGIGCERPDLRIYNPGYFSAGPRPIIGTLAEPIAAQLGGAPLRIPFTGGKLSTKGGVVLMALGSFTHAFDQNQRYVALDYQIDGSAVTATPPADAGIAPEGDYILFLVSDKGVPSVGKHLHLARPAQQIKRTVVFVRAETSPGQDMFIRGGIDHGVAAAQLHETCTADNFLCAMPIRHKNLRNPTTLPWKIDETFLDWYGREPWQSPAAQGTPADWTTNQWTFGDPKRTVAVDGFGEEPLNQWGPHYWMMDVDMDCARAFQGTWFEVKSFVSNGPGWEPDVAQAGAPYRSGNHFAQCGMINKFERGSAAATFVSFP